MPDQRVPDDDPTVKYLPQSERDKPTTRFGGPGSSFPIRPGHPEDVRNAWDLAGHAADPAEIRRNVARIAHELGMEHALPETAHEGGKSAADSAERKHRVIPFDVKATDDADGVGFLEGIGACYFNVDSYNDIIAPGSFSDGLPEFLADGFIGGLNHDWDCPIGHPAEAREMPPQGLYFKGPLDDTDHAQQVRKLTKTNPQTGRATIRKLSIGYEAIEYEMLSQAEVTAFWAKNGYRPSPEDERRAASGPVRLLTRIRLYEISPVTVPANDRAVILAAKAGRVMSRATHGRLSALVDAMQAHAATTGVSHKGMTAILKDMKDYMALHAPPSNDPDDDGDDDTNEIDDTDADDPKAGKALNDKVAIVKAVAAPTLADRSDRLVADATELTEFARKAADQRAADGRHLSRAKRDKLKAAADALAALVAATEPPPDPAVIDAEIAATLDLLRLKHQHARRPRRAPNRTGDAS